MANYIVFDVININYYGELNEVWRLLLDGYNIWLWLS